MQELIKKQDEIITILKEQVESYKKISELNNVIIDKQDEQIKGLTDLVNQSLEIIKQVQNSLVTNQP